ncbi:hypothetical protein [Williamsia deligens]|uniref:ESX secretion-associated protein EspG n=1 Tax=Williamsia deligens TaxID=321325 RepID=A0ABW3G863_9NOCA|nr:hypothetical protein [Williamsia deligens]MCP2192963.1 hypothetical protein [Williamsia deligens]
MAPVDAWRLSTLHFRQLWEESDAADYPLEFAYADADVAAGADTPRLPGLSDLTPPQRAAIDAITRPRVTIAATGLDARRDFADPRHHVRILSATADMTTVYVARQHLGATVDRGATVAITQHAPSQWTHDLVGLLPRSPGAGTLTTDATVAFAPVPGFDIGTVSTVVEPRTPTAATAFARPDPATCGSLRVQVGSIADGRRPTALEVRFRDIVDDGRYLLIVDEPGVAMGVDHKGFASMLNRVVNTLRTRHRAAGD